VHENPYVSETPGVCGGYPVVRGTRIPVRILVSVFRRTGDLVEILAMYPYLTPAQVQGALNYYAAQPARVDEDVARHAHALVELQGR
jgi:uncharacterized protein (DUF433 family)